MINKRHIRENLIEFHNIVKTQGPLAREYGRPRKDDDGVTTLDCLSYRALLRAVGYFQYRQASMVLLRGQTTPTPAMAPNLYRGSHSIGELDDAMGTLIDTYRSDTHYDAAPAQALSTEALLQHYGIRTRWLDVVDSVPHALFFATHEFVDSPCRVGKKTYVPSVLSHGYVYILDLGAPTPAVTDGGVAHGVWECTSGVRVCDLRRAKPSNALRPHAQHGWLVRPAAGQRSLSACVVARLAVPLPHAYQWIGGAQHLSREVLFPPPVWDLMYGTLLSPRIAGILSKVSAAVGADLSTALGGVHRFDFIAGS